MLNMTSFLSAILLALPALPVENLSETTSTSVAQPLSLAVAATVATGAALVSRKVMRRNRRKMAWQQWWRSRRKLRIESPEFLWMAVIIGAVGLLAAVLGLGVLAGITLGAAVLCLIRSFF